MKILFFGGRGWGFSQDMYDYVFKPMGARQHKIRKGVDWRYIWNTMTRDYDLIWSEGEASHLACLTHYLFKTHTAGILRRLYRSGEAKIVSRFHFHDVEPYLKEFKWKAIIALTYSDLPVCVSEYWRKDCLRLLPIYRSSINLKIVHNGVDCSKYVPNPRLKETNTIFYLAVTTPRKRLHLLIQAMKYLEDWKLIIGGKPAEDEDATEGMEDLTIPSEYKGNRAYWDWCHKLSEPYKKRIEWTGFLSEEDKIQLYQGATVFCIPSRVENWAVAPMEAMACGTPATVPDVGGMPEFVPQPQLLSSSPLRKKSRRKLRKFQNTRIGGNSIEKSLKPSIGKSLERKSMQLSARS